MPRIPGTLLKGFSSTNLAGETEYTQAYIEGPATGATEALVPVTGKNVTALLVKNAAGNFYGGSVTNGTTAGYLLLVNLAAIPAANATITATDIIYAAPVAASAIANIGGGGIPDRATVGLVLLLSTSLDTYTVPATPALFMRARAA